jgi:hypothetical protein
MDIELSLLPRRLARGPVGVIASVADSTPGESVQSARVALVDRVVAGESVRLSRLRHVGVDARELCRFWVIPTGNTDLACIPA